MKPINTIPVETFTERVKVATKTNQKNITLDIKDAIAICDTLNIMLSRLVMKISSESIIKESDSTVKINADGGNF